MCERRQVKICRLCLWKTSTFFPLTDNDEISSMLEALTSLRILPTDDISTIMCLKCHLNLKLAFTIQQNMLKAEQRFRDRVESSIKQECDFEESTELKDAEDHKPESKNCEKKQKVLSSEHYTCDICGKIRFSKLSLKNHKDECHTKRKCPICGKEISNSNLSHHVQRHTMVRTVCEICGADVRKQDLRIHMANRHRAPRHKCAFCERPFRQKASKIAHEQREHLNEANYVCETCGKKFYQDRDLKKHIDGKHLKLRPHVCDFCNVGFSSRVALKTHRRQHTNETPYKCDVCGDGFRQNVSLKAHLKSKHNVREELTTECTVCGKKFASKVALFSHSRIH